MNVTGCVSHLTTHRTMALGTSVTLSHVMTFTLRHVASLSSLSRYISLHVTSYSHTIYWTGYHSIVLVKNTIEILVSVLTCLDWDFRLFCTLCQVNVTWNSRKYFCCQTFPVICMYSSYHLSCFYVTSTVYIE
jgi:hypothetical protein